MATVDVIDAQLDRRVGVLHIFGGPRRATYRYDTVDATGRTTSGVPGPDLPVDLADATPDRWGRKLIDRATGVTGQAEYVYLQHMADVARPGSLRFRDTDTGAFWGEDSDIPTMLHAGDVLSEVRAVIGDPSHRVSELINMGSSSIGGARPKAQLRDGVGHLWVAKFAAGDDDPGTEVSVMQAASALGITAAETRFQTVANSGMVLSRRFDRTGDGSRTAMRSLRAAILSAGGDPEDADWADIADLNPGAAPEVFRRAAFGVLVHNTDDHARNHSQLRDTGGVWHLSPAYDITTDTNPGTGHKLGVFGARDPEDAALNLAPFADYLDLDRDRARSFVMDAVSCLGGHGLLPFPDLARAAESAFR